MTNKPDPKAVEAELPDDLETAINEEVGLAIHKFHAASGAVVINPLTREATMNIMALIKSSNQALLERVRDKGPKDPHFHFSPNEYKLGQLDTNAQWHQAIDEIQKELS